jgi:hypothetical protein
MGADVDWIGLAQDRDRWRALVNSVLNLRVPQNARKLSSGYVIGGLSSSSQFHRVSKLGWSGVDWIGLAQDRDRWRALVNSVLNLRVPQNARKLSSVLRTRDLSSSSQLHGVS